MKRRLRRSALQIAKRMASEAPINFDSPDANFPSEPVNIPVGAINKRGRVIDISDGRKRSREDREQPMEMEPPEILWRGDPVANYDFSDKPPEQPFRQMPNAYYTGFDPYAALEEGYRTGRLQRVTPGPYVPPAGYGSRSVPVSSPVVPSTVPWVGRRLKKNKAKARLLSKGEAKIKLRARKVLGKFKDKYLVQKMLVLPKKGSGQRAFYEKVASPKLKSYGEKRQMSRWLRQLDEIRNERDLTPYEVDMYQHWQKMYDLANLHLTDPMKYYALKEKLEKDFAQREYADFERKQRYKRLFEAEEAARNRTYWSVLTPTEGDEITYSQHMREKAIIAKKLADRLNKNKRK